MSDWLRVRAWLARYRYREKRMSTSAERAPLFVDGMAGAFMEGMVDVVCRRDGTSQELGGWKSPVVMGGAFTKARQEEVAPEMRAAVAKACPAFEVTSFVGDLDRDVRADGEEAAGSEKGRAASIWSHRACSLREFLAPVVVLPIRDNFWAPMGRHVRLLNLSDSALKVSVAWGGCGADSARGAGDFVRRRGWCKLVTETPRCAPAPPSKSPGRLQAVS